jgi:hypothetical protein
LGKKFSKLATAMDMSQESALCIGMALGKFIFVNHFLDYSRHNPYVDLRVLPLVEPNAILARCLGAGDSSCS